MGVLGEDRDRRQRLIGRAGWGKRQGPDRGGANPGVVIAGQARERLQRLASAAAQKVAEGLGSPFAGGAIAASRALPQMGERRVAAGGGPPQRRGGPPADGGVGILDQFG